MFCGGHNVPWSTRQVWNIGWRILQSQRSPKGTSMRVPSLMENLSSFSSIPAGEPQDIRVNLYSKSILSFQFYLFFTLLCKLCTWNPRPAMTLTGQFRSMGTLVQGCQSFQKNWWLHSTGYVSHRYKKDGKQILLPGLINSRRINYLGTGSWFNQSLFRVIDQFYHLHGINSLFTLVNHKVSQNDNFL